VCRFEEQYGSYPLGSPGITGVSQMVDVEASQVVEAGFAPGFEHANSCAGPKDVRSPPRRKKDDAGGPQRLGVGPSCENLVISPGCNLLRVRRSVKERGAREIGGFLVESCSRDRIAFPSSECFS